MTSSILIGGKVSLNWVQTADQLIAELSHVIKGIEAEAAKTGSIVAWDRISIESESEYLRYLTGDTEMRWLRLSALGVNNGN